MSAPDWLKAIAPGPRVYTPGASVKPAPRALKPLKGLNARNPERATKEHSRAFGPCSNMARLLGCVVDGCPRHHDRGDRIQAAHVRSRGARGGDFANVVGLCAAHHLEQGTVGILTFQKRHNLDMEEAARVIAEAVSAHDCVSWRRGRTCRVCLRRIVKGAP